MDHPHKISIAGALGGAVNGIFGGGGGMILLPLLTRWSDLEDKKLFATSVSPPPSTSRRASCPSPPPCPT